VVGVLVTGCGGTGGEDDADGAGEAEAGWLFTDDRGVTHTLAEVPDVVVAQAVSAGGLWEYGVEVAGAFGPLRRPDGTPDPSLGLAVPDAFASLGEVDGEVNLEALAALQPDIIVTQLWDDDTL
jgi:iron complex transport system substrate-binding protein